VGTSSFNGSVTYSNGTYTVSGAGSLSGRNDNLNFAWQTMSGDGSITARITELENTGGSARVGVMIRDTLASNSRHVFIGLDGNSTYRWVRRTGFNGNTSTSTSGSCSVPATWVRLIRSGDRITAYKSPDGSTWVEIGSLVAALPENCYAGLAVSSGSNELLNTSSFEDVTVTP
jgi:hypothetical protein